jgi:hypothetical protein
MHFRRYLHQFDGFKTKIRTKNFYSGNPKEHSRKKVKITRCKQVKNIINNEALFHLFFTSFRLVILTIFQNS